MIFRFDAFTLDPSLGQLTREGEDVPIEPRAFELICHLIEHRDRLVTKDELVKELWNGRFISDTAISTLVKTARRALGDDGKTQRLIRTVHGRGFRFTGNVTANVPAEPIPEPPASEAPQSPQLGGQPTIAVLPFRRIGRSETYGAIADAIPSELISSLSRLRWLKVLARGSTFRFREDSPDMASIRGLLGATYCLTGDVEILEPRLALSVELSDTRDGRIVWSDRISGRIEDVHQIRTDIVSRVSSAMELHISLNEADHARLQSPESLDAWSLYHLGLRHMYRFNATDNAIAEGHFSQAIRLDPGFARAYAARSFTSFQSAFVNYRGDRDTEIENARRFAEKSLELDPMDPFGNFNFGRAYWLVNDHESGLIFLDRSIDLSPSFSHGMYAHGLANLMAGRGEAAISKLDAAIKLSPLDPFLYAMQSTKGFSLAHTGDLEQACHWLDIGARQPGAHYLVSIVAAAINKIAGNHDQARYWADRTRQLRPDASIQQFFVAYPLRDQRIRKEVQTALQDLGF
ncbi:winged helix-turn-helix domain-containing protein [Frigidibacter sp. ROC022]|uniref:winged helix-turn-helix domain-containing protein n=1 Tax=Frigidibacter sp. ROC022 TaxID=2971796 RepID=UPI00215A16E7|nr:winged helix-turn-helix domain-containing protein [Frigidibacter sp. ROC022]MCR8723488.1 winged helix-turn-helix domain-containing protein [Frigidibacter sp. ROC022]